MNFKVRFSSTPLYGTWCVTLGRVTAAVTTSLTAVQPVLATLQD